MVDLKEFHKVLLDILLEFDRVCRDNDIQYSLAYGTMLGAIRHKGFIPWDDDVDVVMDRKNYNRFCEVCPKSLRDGYFFQSKDTEPLYPYNISRLRKNNTAMIYPEWKDSGIHQGIYIDIYPVDRIPDNKVAHAIQKFFVILLTPVRITRNPVIYMNGCSKRFGKALYIAKNMLYYVVRLFPQNICDKLEMHYITKYDDKPCKYSGIICEGGVLLRPDYGVQTFDTESLQHYKEVDFEGHKLMCIADPEDMLQRWYGDYMKLPPKEKQVMFHQPEAFDTQKSYKEYV